MMKKKFKKLTSFTLAAGMILSMGVTAFAQDDSSSYEARLYKDGKYNSDAPNDEDTFSMGNDAILDATIAVDGEVYTVTIGIDEEFSAYGFDAEITAVSATDANVTNVDLKDTNNNGINDQIELTMTGFEFGEVINLDFTITAWIMPVSSSGDLVIFA